ncbi:hypothetical protein DdX_20747 [Ditylenchus destructor]|uniref:Uncharacterized protein n=1 Tax=Ditylenchus destructor TaxID=166010 RepID=A0AAD4MFT3_9BILA|nr:hypothetical protein DdX_20747 [Ditylenchus destructor]
MKSKKIDLMQHIQRLNDTGGSLTLDFCKNGVDYLAVTAHYISNSWKKINFIILFSPVPGSMKKTTRNIQELILDDLSQYGITSNIRVEVRDRHIRTSMKAYFLIVSVSL